MSRMEVFVEAHGRSNADTVAFAVTTDWPLPRRLDLSRGALQLHGFEGEAGQVLALPQSDGAMMLVVGVGPSSQVTSAVLRAAAASVVQRARGAAVEALGFTAFREGDGWIAGAAVAEGAVLGAYTYKAPSGLHEPQSTTQRLTIITRPEQVGGVRNGVRHGLETAHAVVLARDLTNTPPSHLSATQLGARAVDVAGSTGLEAEVFDLDRLTQLGCGGIIGVNKGSADPPCVVRLSWSPPGASGHIALVGKGVTYDSGGISLKATSPMHAKMKMDMAGAAVVLAAMSVLRAINCRTAITGFLMCTDNMPSGSALKLGDVLTFRNGKTAEILNTDAEGRLLLADGLALAVEDGVDAVVSVGTLGFAIEVLGPELGAVIGSNQMIIDRLKVAGETTSEPVWQLPLAHVYMALLDSQVADLCNVGGPTAAAITPALFLREFTAGTAWAHLDVAGTMDSDEVDGWLAMGATGFGTRLMIEFLRTFEDASECPAAPGSGH